jgi:ribosomal protein L33
MDYKKRGDSVPTKFCPHCGKRTGFQVKFNVSCRIGDEEEQAYLRECKVCGGRFITIQKDERMEDGTGQSTPN